MGGYTYALEILTGIVGSQARWRTMPWLVLLFGLMIAPLGVVSIFFIIIQPIVIGTWSTLALIAAAAMLVQIPYSLDELVATAQFLRRRVNAGQNWLRVLLFGDTDAGIDAKEDDFGKGPAAFVREMWSGGVNLPWNLAGAGAIGVWLMFTRLTLGASGEQADADHLIGALSLTVVSLAAAEVARPLRYLLILLGLALAGTSFAYSSTTAQLVLGLLCALGLFLWSFRRGPIRGRYSTWQRMIR